MRKKRGGQKGRWREQAVQHDRQGKGGKTCVREPEASCRRDAELRSCLRPLSLLDPAAVRWGTFGPPPSLCVVDSRCATAVCQSKEQKKRSTSAAVLGWRTHGKEKAPQRRECEFYQAWDQRACCTVSSSFFPCGIWVLWGCCQVPSSLVCLQRRCGGWRRRGEGAQQVRPSLSRLASLFYRLLCVVR